MAASARHEARAPLRAHLTAASPRRRRTGRCPNTRSLRGR
ncbi:DUF6274 family protein [Streptomyces sp. SID1328]|nr:DUF6274 family protein [Streptomyces sp. SID1328]